MTTVSDLIVLSFASVLFETLRTQVPEKSGVAAVCASAENVTARTRRSLIKKLRHGSGTSYCRDCNTFTTAGGATRHAAPGLRLRFKDRTL
jgi:hypothetical protein